MPYVESKNKQKLREIRNAAEPVVDGITDKLVCFEVNPEHFQWLLMRADLFSTLIDTWKDYDDNGTKKEHADFFHTFRRIVIEGTMDQKGIK